MLFGYWSFLFYYCCNCSHSLGYLEMQYYRAKLLITATQGKAIDATQALNYCKHKIIICQEAMAGIHSLKSCKPLFASGHDFLIAENVKCWFQWMLVSKERTAGEVQAFYVKIENGEPNCNRLLWFDGLGKIHCPSENLGSLILCSYERQGHCLCTHQ